MAIPRPKDRYDVHTRGRTGFDVGAIFAAYDRLCYDRRTRAARATSCTRSGSKGRSHKRGNAAPETRPPEKSRKIVGCLGNMRTPRSHKIQRAAAPRPQDRPRKKLWGCVGNIRGGVWGTPVGVCREHTWGCLGNKSDPKTLIYQGFQRPRKIQNLLIRPKTY